ncbi:hypothetical protein D3C75_984970 [compost metagenome]
MIWLNCCFLSFSTTSMPLMMGISTSTITTSGCCCATCSSASAPSPASPMTLMPSLSSRFLIAIRARGWSSTITALKDLVSLIVVSWSYKKHGQRWSTMFLRLRNILRISSYLRAYSITLFIVLIRCCPLTPTLSKRERGLYGAEVNLWHIHSPSPVPVVAGWTSRVGRCLQ